MMAEPTAEHSGVVLKVCSNCGGDDQVHDLSFDLDLPTVRLCRVCAYAVVSDRPFFERLGGRA